MKGWGVFLLAFGAGSFLLPLIGVQFRLMALMGEARPFIAGIMIVAGIALLVMGFRQDTGGAPPPPPPSGSPPPAA